jgi:hypothetical protein
MTVGPFNVPLPYFIDWSRILIAYPTRTAFLLSFEGVFVYHKVIFKKLFFKFFCIFLLLKKLVNEKYFLINRKYFSVKEKFNLVFKKMFFFYFEQKTLLIFVFQYLVIEI